MSKMFGLIVSTAIVAASFLSPASAQVNTGGSNFYRAGVPSEGTVLYNRGRSGEFGRNNPWVPGSEFAPARGGSYYGGGRRVMHPMPARRMYGGAPMQRTIYNRRAFTGGAVVSGAYAGSHSAVRQVVVQREPRYVPGPTEHAYKSPYRMISSDTTGNMYEIPLD